ANSDADIYPVDPRLSGDGIRFSAVTPFGVLTDLFIPTLAEHYMINALSAVGCALYCGVSEDFVRGRLAEYRNIDKRFNVITSPSGLTVIDDTYNANPASMDGAVRTLARLPGRTRTAILGDMLELGDYAEELHYELGRTVARLQIDRLCCVGELSAHVAEGAEAAGMDPAHISRFDSSAAMSESIGDGDFRSGDCVLVKGSRSMKMERISLLLINM
ncbi:MAG: hypothetical protein J5758_06410, partial [Abditibacteriota bacterium]|nr:hypothetical protein [Abditibacteriota bacterium]